LRSFRIESYPRTLTDSSFSLSYSVPPCKFQESRGQLKCDGTRAETRFRLSAKWTSPFKSAGSTVQSTTGSRGGRISGSNAGYTMFRGSVKGTGYPIHSPVSPSLPLPCVTVCHHISTGVYFEKDTANFQTLCSHLTDILHSISIMLYSARNITVKADLLNRGRGHRLCLKYNIKMSHTISTSILVFM
jgi:hypothetical protein